MLLTEPEIQRSLARAATAFPRFTAWEYANEADASHAGFSLWGQYSMPPESEPRFFVTFDTDKAAWRGHLTVGKHCYYWSSADFGDAHLLDTERCATLDEAIETLKGRIGSLFAALLSADA